MSLLLPVLAKSFLRLPGFDTWVEIQASIHAGAQCAKKEISVPIAIAGA